MAVWSPSALPVSLVGVGKLPLLLQSGVPADHADDDGCVVHHVLQVRGLCVDLRARSLEMEGR